MDTIDRVILNIHVICGFLSLVAFWLPMLTKKGGRAHILSGKVYVYAMWVVVISAAALSIINLLQHQWILAGFLGFLSLLTAQPLWYGIAILKYKKETPIHLLKQNRILSALIVISGAALLIWGFVEGPDGLGILLIIFGILGVLQYPPVIKSLDTQQSSSSWIIEHIDGMLSSSIAAYTAFFAFGSRSYFAEIMTGYIAVLPWVLPTVFGVIAIRWYKKKYAPAR